MVGSLVLSPLQTRLRPPLSALRFWGRENPCAAGLSLRPARHLNSGPPGRGRAAAESRLRPLGPCSLCFVLVPEHLGNCQTPQEESSDELSGFLLCFPFFPGHWASCPCFLGDRAVSSLPNPAHAGCNSRRPGLSARASPFLLTPDFRGTVSEKGNSVLSAPPSSVAPWCLRRWCAVPNVAVTSASQRASLTSRYC